MANVSSAIRNTIPISRFNRGLAGKIFDEVRATGPKVVMRNNQPECVLLSPEEYLRMVDELEDAKLLALAEERLANYDPEKLISEEEVWKELGLTEEDAAAVGEVEFE